MAQNEQNAGLQIQIPGMDKFKDLKFLQSETNPADLIVQLPDGTEVVFPNYIALAQAGAPTAITLEDGTVIPGDEIVSLIENLNYDLIAPAAGSDVVGPTTGGGAGFSTLELDPDDDIGHGPYANQIQITDDVEVGQFRGYTDDGSGGGGGDLPEISIYDNDGDDYIDMYFKQVQFGTSGAISPNVNRPVDPGPFRVTLETEGPSFADWDGISIQLYAGETLTVTQDPNFAGQYALGVGTDWNVIDGYNPVWAGSQLGWEYVTTDGSISYTATADMLVFIGTGFDGVGPPLGSVFTDIVVDSSGTTGDADLVGGSSDGLFYAGRGDDQITGGAGNDRFVYNDSSTPGHDVITDFQTDLVSGTENDIVDLDALFDAIVPAETAAQRIARVDVDTTTGVLTINHASTVDFSIDLGVTGETAMDLYLNGNIDVS